MPHLTFPTLPQLQHHRIRYGSLCSGIEAATVAWHLLPGWEPAWFSQFDPEHSYKGGPDFPSAVLAHHYPTVPNLGDMTSADWMDRAAALGDIDVLVGGTPCQAFSVAGLREGLNDSRGQLSLRFCEIANAANPQVVLWENVPGVLSDKTNGFGCLLAGLAGEDGALDPPGGKWSNAGCVFGPARTVAWRIIDAQYCGVAQRRRRVFVVACPAASGLDPAAILFEFDGVRRDSPPCRETGEGPAGGAEDGAGIGSRHNSHWNGGPHPPLMQSSMLRGGAPGTSNQEVFEQGGSGLVPVGVDRYDDQVGVDLRNGALTGECAMTLQAGQAGHSPDPGGTPHLLCRGKAAGFKPGQSEAAVAFQQNTSDEVRLMGGDGQIAGCLAAEPGMKQQNYIAQPAVAFDTYNQDLNPHITHALRDGNSEGTPAALIGAQIRRLTPVECERLQGFPDNYTLIPWKKGLSPDGPRYKALGNSMAVPVMRWIGLRIHLALTQPHLLEKTP